MRFFKFIIFLVFFLSSTSGVLLHLDEHHQSKISAKSLAIYRKAIKPFADFLEENAVDIETAEEADDMMLEWKFLVRPSKATFTACRAAILFLIPSFKNSFPSIL